MIGVPVDQVRIVITDSDQAPYAGASGGSKITYTVGLAVKAAAEDARRQILAIAAVAGFLYIFVLSSSINGLCHHRGYKNFQNTAGNFRSIALITGGEGLHNNHHGAPRSPKFSVRKSEFDPAWPVLRVMEFLRLAKLGKVKS